MKGDIETRLAAHSPTPHRDPDLQDSAVILCLQGRDDPRVAFVRRTDYRDEHAGEIGLPGGRAEPGDDFPEETALREFEEELGVPAARVDLLGRLDDEATPTGYRIVPFVGHVDPTVEFDPCEEEVGELVSVPLSVLLDQHAEREEPRFEYGDAVVWGATGRIVSSFLTVLE